MSTHEIKYVEIDSVDQKIIDCIEPGIRYNHLVKATGLNKNTVRYRLLRLEKVGIVQLVSGKQTLKIYPANYPIPESARVKLVPVNICQEARV